MNMSDRRLPLLVAFTLDGKITHYGVMTRYQSETQNSCSIIGINVLARESFSSKPVLVPAENVEPFNYYYDYSMVKSGSKKTSFMGKLIIRTTSGKIGLVQDIRLVTPYPEPTAWVRILGDEHTTEIQLSSIESFIGHESVNISYQ